MSGRSSAGLKDDRQMHSLLRVRQVLTESVRSFRKVGVIAADVVRSNLFERYVDVPLEMLNSFGAPSFKSAHGR